ncbi:MAG: hypothetical protein K0U60_09080 [Actinomycetia bacterium]|nr:hypothetical protein [Actinomycetes bacterium]MCH9800844.1 hypothetical protein [Actinomycetes bacterium]
MTVESADAAVVDSAESRHRPMWPYALLLFISGFILGLFGAFISAITVPVVGINIPVGLVLVFATLFSSLRLVIHVFGLRRAGVFLLVGWLLATVLMALPGPGDDVAIPSDPIAMVYLFGGVIIGTACVNVPARLRRKPAATPSVATKPDVGQGGNPS